MTNDLYILTDISPTRATVGELATIEAVEDSGDQHEVARCPAGTVTGDRVRLSECELVSDPVALFV